MTYCPEILMMIRRVIRRMMVMEERGSGRLVQPRVCVCNLVGVGPRQILKQEGLPNQLRHIPRIEPLHRIIAMDFDGLGADL